LTALPVTPSVRYSSQFSTIATTGVAPARVSQIADIQGLANAVAGASGVGPQLLTDAYGRKFLRLEGTEYMTIAAALTGAINNYTVAFVGRFHRGMQVVLGWGSADNGTAVNTAGAALRSISSTGTGNAAWVLGGSNGASYSDATNKVNMVCGAQLGVYMVSANSTRLRFKRNNDTATKTGVLSTAFTGAEIGRSPISPGTSGNWGFFDLYELAIWNSGLSDANTDAVAAALVDGWSIPALTNLAVIDGDSINQGVTIAGSADQVPSGKNFAMRLTDPGPDQLMPGSWCVANFAISGAQVSGMIAKQTSADSIFGFKAPGRNVVLFEIGRNDLTTGGKTDVTLYGDVATNPSVCYCINGSATSWGAKGWEVVAALNLGFSAVPLQTYNANLWADYRNISKFRTDTGMTSANLRICETPSITVGGVTIYDGTHTANDTYYQGDSTHPTALGTGYIAAGGDNGANGYAQRILAAA
jgi:hypothetical protein